MSGNKISSVLLFVLLAILTLYIVAHIEVYEEEVDTGYEREAIQNSYLAAEYFLAKYDTELQTIFNYRRLFSGKLDSVDPLHSDAILLTEAEVLIQASQSEQILKWVEQGGHLLLSVEPDDPSEQQLFAKNALIQSLGVNIQELSAEQLEQYIEPDSYRGNMKTSVNSADGEPALINLAHRYRITFDMPVDLFYAAGDDQGNTFVQLHYGQGMVTLATEFHIWNNWQLSDDDNLILLHDLLAEHEHVYLFWPVKLPDWFDFLTQEAPYFMPILIILGLLGLWHFSARFGSIATHTDQYQQLFSEHIRAAGEFYWRDQQQAALIEPLQQSVINTAQRHWPHLRHQDSQQAYPLLAKCSGWNEQEIVALMELQLPLTESAFVEAVKRLQQLRNSI